MSNLPSVQALYEAFGRGDVPGILDLLADDVAWESWADNHAQNAGVDHLAPRYGKDGVAEFFGIIATFDVTDFQVLAMMEGGNQVACEIVIEARLPNGGSYRDEEVHLWTFDGDGKISRMRHYVDTAKHVAASQGADTIAAVRS